MGIIDETARNMFEISHYIFPTIRKGEHFDGDNWETSNSFSKRDKSIRHWRMVSWLLRSFIYYPHLKWIVISLLSYLMWSLKTLWYFFYMFLTYSNHTYDRNICRNPNLIKHYHHHIGNRPWRSSWQCLQVFMKIAYIH